MLPRLQGARELDFLKKITFFVNTPPLKGLFWTFWHFWRQFSPEKAAAALWKSRKNLYYFGNYCDYVCQNWQFQQQKLGKSAAALCWWELLLLELSILTKIITIITKIINTTPQTYFFSLFGTFGVNSRRKKAAAAPMKTSNNLLLFFSPTHLRPKI